MWRKSKFATLMILGPLAFGFAIALDIYIPVVPKLVHILHTTPGEVQLTLSLFLLFVGLGQLAWGPLSDHFGRRKIALTSLFLYILGSLFCAISPSVVFLIIGRVIEAIGACGTMVIAMAVVRDAYDKRESARMYSLINGMIAASPLFAPLIGGYLVTWFDWRAPFVLLIIVGVIMTFVVMFFLDESLAVDKRIHINLTVFKRYLAIIKNPQAVIFIFIVASGVSTFFTFFSMSPYLVIGQLHVPVENFGYYFGILGVVFFVGSLLSSWIAPHFGVYRTVLLGVILMLLGGILMASWVMLYGLTKLGFVIPMIPVGIGGAFMIGAGAAGALSPFGNMAGTASAVLGCGEFLLSSIIGSIAIHYKTNTTMPLAVTVLAVAIISLIAMIVARKRIRN